MDTSLLKNTHRKVEDLRRRICFLWLYAAADLSVGNMRGACTPVRHHGADRQRPAPRIGVTARCPSCHAIITDVSTPPVAVHWPLAPPTCPSPAWLLPIELGNALGRCSGQPL